MDSARPAPLWEPCPSRLVRVSLPSWPSSPPTDDSTIKKSLHTDPNLQQTIFGLLQPAYTCHGCPAPEWALQALVLRWFTGRLEVTAVWRRNRYQGFPYS